MSAISKVDGRDVYFEESDWTWRFKDTGDFIGTLSPCFDCGLPYGEDGFADLIVPNDVWEKIAPREGGGGVLCPTCMVRAAARAGIACPASFFSGPFAADSMRLRLSLHLFRLRRDVTLLYRGLRYG